MSKKKPRLIDKYRAIQAIGSQVPAPWEVQRLFPGKISLEVIGDQVSLGEDYVSVQEIRQALEFLVTQMGGTVSWEKD